MTAIEKTLIGLGSRVNFLSRHLFGSYINAEMVSGAIRRCSSFGYSGYTQNARDMIHWQMYSMEENRLLQSVTVSSLNESDTPLPGWNYFVTQIMGLIKIEKAGACEINVSGDDDVHFFCNGETTRRGTKTFYFDAPGYYDFTLFHQDSSGAENYMVRYRHSADEDWQQFGPGKLFHYAGKMRAGLLGIRTSTQTTYPPADKTDYEAYMRNHEYARQVSNFIYYDNYAYRFRDRGNYWGYIFEGYIRFPISGEWEIGTYSDNWMDITIGNKHLTETRPPAWDRIIRPTAETIMVSGGRLMPIKVMMGEITGGEIFLFAIRRKGTTAWITDLTGLVYHDEESYSGRMI